MVGRDSRILQVPRPANLAWFSEKRCLRTILTNKGPCLWILMNMHHTKTHTHTKSESEKMYMEFRLGRQNAGNQDCQGLEGMTDNRSIVRIQGF